MEIKKEIKKDCYAVKITAEENGTVLGRVFLYVIFNGLHAEPYGLVEDLFVEEAARQRGLGTQLVKAAIVEAKARQCYKLIGTTRYSKKDVQEWYQRIGFADFGKEFRMDFK